MKSHIDDEERNKCIYGDHVRGIVKVVYAGLGENADTQDGAPNVTRERDMVVIEIAPKRVALWRYADPSSEIERGALYLFQIEQIDSYTESALMYSRA